MSRSSVPIPSFIAFGLHLCVDSHQQRLAAPCLHLCHDIHLASRPRRDVGSSDLELRYTAARMCATISAPNCEVETLVAQGIWRSRS